MKDQMNDIPTLKDPKDFTDFKAISGRKFMFFNVRSLLPNINLLRYELSDSNILLIGICETWLTERIHDGLIQIDGYNTVRLDRRTGKRGGGLIFYVNNTIKYDQVSDDLNSSDINLEMLTILIKPDHQRNFLVSLVYIPPSADKSLAIEQIKSTNKVIDGTSSLRLIAGDFNMDYSAKTRRATENVLLRDLERSLGLTQMISSPTRVTTSTASIIDLIFFSTTHTDNISRCVVTDMNISDHRAVCLAYKKDSIKVPRTSFTFRRKNKYNLAVLLHNFDQYVGLIFIKLPPLLIVGT